MENLNHSPEYLAKQLVDDWAQTGDLNRQHKVMQLINLVAELVSAERCNTQSLAYLKVRREKLINELNDLADCLIWLHDWEHTKLMAARSKMLTIKKELNEISAEIKRREYCIIP